MNSVMLIALMIIACNVDYVIRSNATKTHFEFDTAVHDREHHLVECPQNHEIASVEDLRRLGNRLVYEGDLYMANACFKLALKKMFISTQQDASTSSSVHEEDRIRFRSYLRRSREISDSSFQSLIQVGQRLREQQRHAANLSPWGIHIELPIYDPTRVERIQELARLRMG